MRGYSILTFLCWSNGIATASTTNANPYLPDPAFPIVGYQQTTVPINFVRRGLSALTGISDLPVEVWYPASMPADDSTPSPATIVLDFLLSKYEIPIVDTFGPTVEAVFENIPLGTSPTGFPVVVFSHGNQGIAFQNVYLMNALAQQGFVVVAIDHLGNSALDAARFFFKGSDFLFDDILFNRVGDVFAVLDAIESLFPPGMVDASRASIVGHSLGAQTAMQVALKDDPRIQAVVGLAPLFMQGIQDLDIPLFLMAGEQDQILPSIFNASPILEALRQRVNALPETPTTAFFVDILDAAHNSFTDLCFWQELLEEQSQDQQVPFIIRSAIKLLLPILGAQTDRPCKDSSVADFEMVNDLVAMYTVSFLKVNAFEKDTGDDASQVTEFESLLQPSFATQNSFAVVFEDTTPLTLPPSLSPTIAPTPGATPLTLPPSLSPTPESSTQNVVASKTVRVRKKRRNRKPRQNLNTATTTSSPRKRNRRNRRRRKGKTMG